nr:alkaline phosphatase family protein [Actinomycetes bacterium]
GALAVALGVGAAMAAVPAVAFADATGSAGSTGLSSSSASVSESSSGADRSQSSSETEASLSASGSGSSSSSAVSEARDSSGGFPGGSDIDDSSDVDASEVDAPDVEASDVDASDVDASDVDAPDVDASDVDASDVDASEVDAPDVDAPDVDAPDVDAPDVDTPEVDASGDDASDIDAPTGAATGGNSGSVVVAGGFDSDSSASADGSSTSVLAVPTAPSVPSVSDEGEVSAEEVPAGVGDDPPAVAVSGVSSGDSTNSVVAADVFEAAPVMTAGTPDAVAIEPLSASGAGAQGSGNGLDVPAAVLGLATLGFASRREGSPGAATAASQQGDTQLANLTPQASLLAEPIDTNVLLISIDGTRLQAILDDPANVNLFALMAGGDIVTPNGTTPIVGGTTAASTIVGHTTISLPSYTAILNGVWGETAGVINNVYYPETADEYPTVFNTLEATFGDNIQTMAIANWVDAAALADAESLGTPGADVVQYVEGFEDDPIFTKSDDRVGELTVQAIEGTNPGCGGPCPVPDFLFSYFGGVDESGHEYGGGSIEYERALRNVDKNVGEIMEAVIASGEDWTVLVNTDHGQATTRGPIGELAHGLQDPEETTTFVIAWDGKNPTPIFEPGAINNQYSIIDTSPTVLDLFGGPDLPPTWYEGVPLSEHDASTVKPVDPDGLRPALLDAIGMYGYPDVVTQWNLTWRTIFATGPYLVYNFTNDIVAAVEEILPSPFAELITVPVQIIGDLIYMVTNIPARIVAKITGVDTSIFPLLPPAPPSPPLAPTALLAPSAPVISVGDAPTAVVLTPDSSTAYVTNAQNAVANATVSVIDTKKQQVTNSVLTTISGVGDGPHNVAVSPNGGRGYVTNYGSNTMSVIATNPSRGRYNTIRHPRHWRQPGRGDSQ